MTKSLRRSKNGPFSRRGIIIRRSYLSDKTNSRNFRNHWAWGISQEVPISRVTTKIQLSYEIESKRLWTIRPWVQPSLYWMCIAIITRRRAPSRAFYLTLRAQQTLPSSSTPSMVPLRPHSKPSPQLATSLDSCGHLNSSSSSHLQKRLLRRRIWSHLLNLTNPLRISVASITTRETISSRSLWKNDINLI